MYRGTVNCTAVQLTVPLHGILWNSMNSAHLRVTLSISGAPLENRKSFDKNTGAARLGQSRSPSIFVQTVTSFQEYMANAKGDP